LGRGSDRFRIVVCRAALVLALPPGHTSVMHQEREDYADPASPQRPWTRAQVAVLAVIVLLCLLLTLIVLAISLSILSGGIRF